MWWAAIEYDPIHAAIHELNFPQCKTICSDVRKLTGDDIRLCRGHRKVARRSSRRRTAMPRVLAHRPPSSRRFSRNELVFHFLRIVKELQPRAFNCLRTIPGMATGKHHELLDELIGDFEKLGYRVRTPFRILNAQRSSACLRIEDV